MHSDYITETLQPTLQEECFNDATTSKKVASLFRMLYDVVKESTFKIDLSKFIEKWLTN